MKSNFTRKNYSTRKNTTKKRSSKNHSKNNSKKYKTHKIHTETKRNKSRKRKMIRRRLMKKNIRKKKSLTSIFSGGGFFNDIRTMFRGGIRWGEGQINAFNGTKTTTPSPYPSKQDKLPLK